MRVYLVRHGKAAQSGYSNDADRPLTDRGRSDVERIARRMAKARLTVHQIRPSGLVRARETAEILGNVLNPPGGVIAVAGLKFSDPVDTLARELRLEPEPVMLVGHNPFMEDLASMLLIGEPGHRPLWFTTAGTACFEYDHGEWSLRWMLTPEIVQKAKKG